MNLAKAEGTAIALAALLVVGGLAFYVWRKGGIAGAAAGAGAAAVNAAGAAASGAVGAVGAAVGLPTPDETTTDPAVARWLIDNYGHLEASRWCGAWALIQGEWMSSGTGTPPPAGSPVAIAHPQQGSADPSVAASSARYNTGGLTNAAGGLVNTDPAASWSDLAGIDGTLVPLNQ